MRVRATIAVAALASALTLFGATAAHADPVPPSAVVVPPPNVVVPPGAVVVPPPNVPVADAGGGVIDGSPFGGAGLGHIEGGDDDEDF